MLVVDADRTGLGAPARKCWMIRYVSRDIHAGGSWLLGTEIPHTSNDDKILAMA